MAFWSRGRFWVVRGDGWGFLHTIDPLRGRCRRINVCFRRVGGWLWTATCRGGGWWWVGYCYLSSRGGLWRCTWCGILALCSCRKVDLSRPDILWIWTDSIEIQMVLASFHYHSCHLIHKRASTQTTISWGTRFTGLPGRSDRRVFVSWC